jgi:teichuronic acid biosynthesis protein TuaE
MKKYLNILNFLLFILPLLTCFWAYLPSVSGINVILLLLISVTPTTFVMFAKNFKVLGKIVINGTYMYLVWIFWGIISLFWAPDFLIGFRELLAVVYGFIVFIVIFHKKFDEERKILLINGWMFSLFAVLVIGLWEYLTGNHLQSDYSESLRYYNKSDFIYSVFGNPNDFSAFLITSVPFIGLFVIFSKRILEKYVGLSLYAFTVAGITLSGGRIGIFFHFLQIGIFVLSLKNSFRVFLLKTILFPLAILIVFTFISADEAVSQKANRDLTQDDSVESRVNLSINGLKFTVNSYGFGIGAGGYEHYAETSPDILYTGGIINPHNLIIEILSQYGLVILVFFLSFLVFLLQKSFFICRNNMAAGMLMVISIFSVVITGFQGSSALNLPTMWLNIGWIAYFIKGLTYDNTKVVE